MNTYSENLQNTVSTTLAALAAQQATLSSALTSAEYALYYAQSAEITALEKRNGTDANVAFSQQLNNQAIINKNQSFNLLATAKGTNTNVTASNTNMATAAANVQIASNAVAALAADIGAALNIATASLYDTQTYKKILEANGFVNEVANDAKSISLQSMDAASKTSEIISAVAQSQSANVDGQIGNVLNASQAELDKYTSLSIAENASLAAAKQAERQAEGVRHDATTQAAAISTAYLSANSNLNYGLVMNAVSADIAMVAFQALDSPLPVFRALPASAIPIPDAEPVYYLAVLTQAQSSVFSLDNAEQLFSQKDSLDGPYFYSVEPADAAQPNRVQLTKDVFGNPINAGQSYVAFLYIELSMEYKRYIGNFSDLLSASSNVFTPATMLTPAKNIVPVSHPVQPGGTLPSGKLSYTTLRFDATPVQAPVYQNANTSISTAQDGLAQLQAAINKLSQGSALSGPLADMVDAGGDLISNNFLATQGIALAIGFMDLIASDNVAEQQHEFSRILAFLNAGIKSQLQLAAGSLLLLRKAAGEVAEQVNPSLPGDSQAAEQARVFAAACMSNCQCVAEYQTYQSDYSQVQYRCIVIPQNLVLQTSGISYPLSNLGLDTCSSYPNLATYFNQAIAEQVPTSNLELAGRTMLQIGTSANPAAKSRPAKAQSQAAVETDSAAQIAATDAEAGPDSAAVPQTLTVDSASQMLNLYQTHFIVKFDDTSTDTFGNKLEKDVLYQSFVLTTLPGSNAYLNAMAESAASVVLLTGPAA